MSVPRVEHQHVSSNNRKVVHRRRFSCFYVRSEQFDLLGTELPTMGTVYEFSELLSRTSQMDYISFVPIGTVHSPHTDPAQTPKQTESARGIAGTVEIRAEFAAGLKDLAEFEYIWLIVSFHKAAESREIW